MKQEKSSRPPCSAETNDGAFPLPDRAENQTDFGENRTDSEKAVYIQSVRYCYDTCHYSSWIQTKYLATPTTSLSAAVSHGAETEKIFQWHQHKSETISILIINLFIIYARTFHIHFTNITMEILKHNHRELLFSIKTCPLMYDNLFWRNTLSLGHQIFLMIVNIPWKSWPNIFEIFQNLMLELETTKISLSQNIFM